MSLRALKKTMIATALLLPAPHAANAQKAAHNARDLQPYLITSRAAEISLARSAATPDVSGAATVLVLTRTGYVEASHGTNGFTCLVLRSFAAALNDPNFWNTRVRSPLCLTPPAVRTVLPAMLKRAEWITAGVDTTEIAARTKQAYASHEFPMPAAGAMAYMISPRQHLQDDAPTNWMPHVMFFYAGTLPPSDLGAGGGASTLIDGTGGVKGSPVEVILIPVRHWSDGTTPVAPAHAKKG